MKISISKTNECSNLLGRLEYAVKEARHFLEKYTAAIIAECEPASSACKDADASVFLCIDETLEAHHYSLQGDGRCLKISGGNASSVLCGLYEALAEAGILFEATGYSVCEKFDLDTFLSINRLVRPKSRQRGIRQHINFPMDISSYALKDAQEYIRSLARMRYNAITFHSYGGQWHSTVPADPENLAGHFFYGQHHPVTTKDPLTASRIDNHRTYCIPEAESIYEDEKLRSDYAQYWLQEVMKTVKEAEMELTLSVELPFDDVCKNYEMLQEVCRTYPMIDTLELLSYEGGGDDKIDITLENMEETISGIFGSKVLNPDGTLEGKGSSVCPQFPGAVVCLKRILEVLNNKDVWTADLEKIPALRGGLYITSVDVLKILWPILCKCIPDGMTKSLLPAHGALAAADNIAAIVKEEDWQDTMFYSWAEFDGNMYLQQLSTDGLEKLTEMPQAESIYGFCINHWRTSENSMTISYAAKTAIKPMTADAFYKETAAQKKIGKAEEFADACTRLAKLDTYNRDHLFNIGFCYVGCWINPTGVVTKPRRYPEEAQKYAIAEYTALKEEFMTILPSVETEQGIALIRLLINRCQTSIWHICSMLKLDEIMNVYDYDAAEPLTEMQQQKIRKIVEEAHVYAQNYIQLYGEIMPDRGCQGLIASYYETTPVFIDVVAGWFDDSVSKKHTEAFDAPPSPDAQAK